MWHCDRGSAALCFNAVSPFTKSPRPAPDRGPEGGCLGRCHNQLWSEAAFGSGRSGRFQKVERAACGSVSLQIVVIHRVWAAVSRAPPAGSCSDHSQHWPHRAMASTLSSTFLKKLLHKQEYPQQTGRGLIGAESSTHQGLGLEPPRTFLKVLMQNQKLRWRQRLQFKFPWLPRSTVKPLWKHHSTPACISRVKDWE